MSVWPPGDNPGTGTPNGANSITTIPPDGMSCGWLAKLSWLHPESAELRSSWKRDRTTRQNDDRRPRCRSATALLGALLYRSGGHVGRKFGPRQRNARPVDLAWSEADLDLRFDRSNGAILTAFWSSHVAQRRARYRSLSRRLGAGSAETSVRLMSVTSRSDHGHPGGLSTQSVCCSIQVLPHLH